MCIGQYVANNPDNPDSPDNAVSELASLMNIYIHSYDNADNLIYIYI